MTGVDVSEGQLAAAREYADARGASVDWVRVDATRLPFDDETFDGLVAFKVLCYVPSAPLRRDVLREWHRVVKPGGLALLIQHVVPPEHIGEARDEHFARSPAAQFAILEEGDSFPAGEGYVRWFTESELIAELQASPFIVGRFESDEAFGGEGHLRLIRLKKDEE